MAVIPTKVNVPSVADGPGVQEIDNVEVNTGLANPVKRQVTSLADPETPAARARIGNSRPGVTDYGLAVRGVPANRDSGRVVLPATLTAIPNVTANDVDADFVVFINQTNQIQLVYLTNGSDAAYLDATPLLPRQVLPIPLGGITLANGAKWRAGNASAVVAQFKGNQ